MVDAPDPLDPLDPAETAWRSRITRNAATLGLATGVYGISFGVLAVQGGLAPLQAYVMSLLAFTGASQFAFVGVIGAGGGAVAALVPAFLLGARNAVYGLAAVPILRGGRAQRALQAHFVIDETIAMARGQDDRARAQHAFATTGAAVFLFWNLGTLLGALLGSGIGDPRRYGLDVMFPAAILALLAPQLRRPGAPTAAIIGALIAIALIPFAPPGLPVLAAVAAVVPGILIARRAAVASAP